MSSNSRKKPDLTADRAACWNESDPLWCHDDRKPCSWICYTSGRDVYKRQGLDYAYVAFDIKEDKVKDAIAAMKTFNMRGYNVTMPDKVDAAKYMDELSPAAQISGAVNTIVNDNGKLTGHITDGEGFVHNLRDHGIEIKGKKITVAGAVSYTHLDVYKRQTLHFSW